MVESTGPSRRVSRQGLIRATVGGVIAILLGTAVAAGAPGKSPPARPAGQGGFAGLVDIRGRRLYLECQGAGQATVVLEAGYGNRADIWSVDLLQPEMSRSMVFPGVAGFTRVCAYDRPGTIGQVNPEVSPLPQDSPLLPSRSDPAPMPRTAQELVADLHAVLRAGGAPGPYVLVGHSLGGLVVRLFASTYPEEVAGIFLVDAAQEEQNTRLQAVVPPTAWAALEQLQDSPPAGLEGYQGWERVDFDASFGQMRQARENQPLRPIPLAVLTRGRPDDVPIADWPVDAVERTWRALQDELARLVPNARHSIATRSGHYVQQEQPELVLEAVRQVVAGVRQPDTWDGLVSCCAR